jgi:hypothetical protein
VWLATNPHLSDLGAAATAGMTPQRFVAKYGLGAEGTRAKGGDEQ